MAPRTAVTARQAPALSRARLLALAALLLVPASARAQTGPWPTAWVNVYSNPAAVPNVPVYIYLDTTTVVRSVEGTVLVWVRMMDSEPPHSTTIGSQARHEINCGAQLARIHRNRPDRPDSLVWRKTTWLEVKVCQFLEAAPPNARGSNSPTQPRARHADAL